MVAGKDVLTHRFIWRNSVSLPLPADWMTTKYLYFVFILMTLLCWCQLFAVIFCLQYFKSLLILPWVILSSNNKYITCLITEFKFIYTVYNYSYLKNWICYCENFNKFYFSLFEKCISYGFDNGQTMSLVPEWYIAWRHEHCWPVLVLL